MVTASTPRMLSRLEMLWQMEGRPCFKKWSQPSRSHVAQQLKMLWNNHGTLSLDMSASHGCCKLCWQYCWIVFCFLSHSFWFCLFTYRLNILEKMQTFFLLFLLVLKSWSSRTGDWYIEFGPYCNCLNVIAALTCHLLNLLVMQLFNVQCG